MAGHSCLIHVALYLEFPWKRKNDLMTLPRSAPLALWERGWGLRRERSAER